jgi:hypothetical protein
MKQPCVAFVVFALLLFFVPAAMEDFLTWDFPSGVNAYEPEDEEKHHGIHSQQTCMISNPVAALLGFERNICLRRADIPSGVCCGGAIVILRR